MARPTARVLSLLELLQSGGVRTVAELADRLDVDERTVRRYVDHLLDLDVPVESVRGRYGGYRLASGYRMPPLMLSDDEALAVLLGLVAGRRTGLMTTTGTASETAAAKIRRIRYRSRTKGRTNTKPHQRPVAQSTTMTAAIQIASSSRITSDDFRCRRSHVIVAD